MNGLRKRSLREKFNIYAGIVLGYTIPITVARYTIFSDAAVEDPGSALDLVSWAGSALMCTTSLISPIASVAGGLLGTIEASELRQKRRESESQLEIQ